MHFLKAISLTVDLRYLGTLYVHPVTSQFFLLHRGIEVAPLAETLSYYYHRQVI